MLTGLERRGESTWSGWEWPTTKQVNGVQSRGQWSTQVQGPRLAMVNAGPAKISGLEVNGGTAYQRLQEGPAD
jgi:hypothetical protein